MRWPTHRLSCKVASESANIGCHWPHIHPSPFVSLLCHKTHFIVLGSVEGFVDLGTAVRVCSYELHSWLYFTPGRKVFQYFSFIYALNALVKFLCSCPAICAVNELMLTITLLVVGNLQLLVSHNLCPPLLSASRNDLYCVGWGVKLLTHSLPHTIIHKRENVRFPSKPHTHTHTYKQTYNTPDTIRHPTAC